MEPTSPLTHAAETALRDHGYQPLTFRHTILIDGLLTLFGVTTS